MVLRWSKFNEVGLAGFVVPELPASFKLPSTVNRLESIHWDKYQLVKEIYNTLMKKNIKYALEPFNSERNIQMIRTSQEILETLNEGTCLDLAILFCGICYACDLIPLLIVLNGHALAAVSMSYERKEWWNNSSGDGEREKERKLFEQEPLRNHKQLTELINSGNFLPIECTGFSSSPTVLPEDKPEGVGRTTEGFLSFERAIEAGKEQLNTSGRKLRFALDISITHEYWKIPNQDLNLISTVNQCLNEGCKLLKDRKFEEAEAKFEEAQKLESKSPEPWYWKAQLALAKNNKKVALAYINRALKLNPNYWYGLALKIKLLLLMGGKYREEAKNIAEQSHEISDELVSWLNCLEQNNCFNSIIITNSELDEKCPFPSYSW